MSKTTIDKKLTISNDSIESESSNSEVETTPTKIKIEDDLLNVEQSKCTWNPNNGVIYKITNLKNNKLYIGQALNVVSCKLKWGARGRWRSHITESVMHNDQHCRVLNKAIRKYGYHNFKVEVIDEYPIPELDEKEIFYIDEFKTLSPTGYNLRTGGAKGKDSDETRAKKSAAFKGKIVKDETKEKNANSQIGNRREAKERKYEEDKDLPKYIICNRRKEKITGYSIKNYPVGVEKKEYVDKHFLVSKYESTKECLDDCLKSLKELEDKYQNINEKIKEKRISDYEKKVVEVEKKELDKKLYKLPKYVSAILDTNDKIRGYMVSGYPKIDGGVFPDMKFESAHNYRNLEYANEHIKLLEIKNKDIQFLEVLKGPKYQETLPGNRKNIMYKYDTDKKTIIGFKLQFGDNQTKDKFKGKVVFQFTDPQYTLEHKYHCYLKFYDDFIQKKVSPENYDWYDKNRYNLI